MTTCKKNSLPNEQSPSASVEGNVLRLRNAGYTKKPKCKLDAEGRINLQDILLSFNGPINQEQAWALCYQTARSMSRFSDNKFCRLSELSQIVLHKDGDVWLGDLTDTRHPHVSEQQAVFSLGIIVFKALDFGIDQEEERPLSPDLEDLITLMTSSNEECEGNTEERLQETDDEGIERDSGDGDADEFSLEKASESYEDKAPVCSLKTVLRICTRHIQSTNEYAETHYRAVIRAFVAEALELSQFLEKVATEKQHSTFKECPNEDGMRRGSASQHNLDALDFNDWTDVRIWRAIQARFWVQVIGELRRGVKLKKVEANLNNRGTSRGRGKGAEFELTPYEILMNDIRERRYHLRKTPSPSQHLRKDAHAVILEFIRSRPPLKKASERQLPPLQTESTLRELLMESIKKPPKPLRSTTERRQISTLKETDTDKEQVSKDTYVKEDSSPTSVPKPPRRDLDLYPKQRPRKLIPVDFDLKLDADDDDDDDDYNEELTVTRFEEDEESWQLGKGDRCNRTKEDDEPDSANPWRSTGGLRLTRNEYHRFCDAQLESYDLATQCPTRRASARKHAAKRGIPLTAVTGTTSLPHSRPQSRQQAGATGSTLSPGQSPNISLNPSPSLSPQPRMRKPQRAHTIADSKDSQDHIDDCQEDTGQKPSLGDMFLDERLSLTLEEIVHIRSVLTKAELESLPVEGRVKEDVEKRRVCFLCLKTRFGILGPWGQRCRLCERTVCVKCYSKMRIPTEHFAHVPVVLLSPGLLLSPSSEPDAGGKTSWLRGPSAVGSAPASPASRRKDSALRSLTPSSTPTTTPVSMPTPNSVSPAHLRRDLDNSTDKRLYKVTGSPAALSTTKTFSTSSGPSSEQRLAAERLRGVAMVVCHDCRIMVIQIIKSSRTTRATIRNNVISRLTLNLSPAYV